MPRRSLGQAATTALRVGIAALVMLAGGIAYGVFQYFHSSYWTRVGLAEDQPVLFSHRHHAGQLRIDCRFCHASVESAAFAGMPTVATCLGCHRQVLTDTALLAPVRRSAELGVPLRWTRVTRLPDHVHFHHGVHVSRGVDCGVCHGEVARMALTAKARSLDMRWCVDCHREVAPDAGGREPAPTPTAAAGHLTNCSTCHY
ncbi:MAG TPA: cytochrome c3 family protein [Lacunisphaera sp.]|nr:cytochrome c3 family protein [Lacunisphaera sp.]